MMFERFGGWGGADEADKRPPNQHLSTPFVQIPGVESDSYLCVRT